MKRILFSLLIIVQASQSWAINEAFAVGYAHDSEFVLSQPQVTTAPDLKLSINESLELKIMESSASLLGKPYAVSPLGEAKGLDVDPLVRYDKFDCTTFVETSLALALASDSSQVVNYMNRIRYKDSKIDFVTRNHFTNVDWVKNNSWLLKEATTKYYPKLAITQRTLINKTNWFDKNFHLKFNLPIEMSVVNYLSFEEIKKDLNILNQLPQVVMFSIVRKNWALQSRIGTDLDISHQGFIMRTAKGIIARHASQRHQITIEQPIETFIAEMQMASPTVVGVQILELNETINGN